MIQAMNINQLSFGEKYRDRLYDPAIGRFLTVDPHPGKLIDPLSTINSYSYVGNNPLNYFDALGTFKIGKFLKAVVVTAAIVAAAYFTGGAAIAFFGATGATAIGVGAVAGAIAGAAVGGVGFEMSGIGSFRQGATFGAIVGAAAGSFAAPGIQSAIGEAASGYQEFLLNLDINVNLGATFAAYSIGSIPLGYLATEYGCEKNEYFNQKKFQCEKGKSIEFGITGQLVE